MAKRSFEFARIASPDEIADYLRRLAGGLGRGEVSLASGARTLRLTGGSEIRLEVKVTQDDGRGKIALELGWRADRPSQAGELRVAVGRRRDPAAG